VVFQKPVIGPKVYLARGPSGQIETFKREASDRNLELALGKVPLKTALEGFIRKKLRDKTKDTWEDVTGYLSALTHIPISLLQIDIVISFWAHVVLTRESIERSEKGN
jgi:hypothetical protein